MPFSTNSDIQAPPSRMSIAETVFEEMQRQIRTLQLLPGEKISEAEVSKALGVSRQPVRDAFYRLSKQGFLNMRPQVATTVAMISTRAFAESHYIRKAIEVETIRTACRNLTDEDFTALQKSLDAQKKAIDAEDSIAFHELDDEFHQQICERAGVGFVWGLIRENKAHIDRICMLSLSFSSDIAYEAHLKIFDALKARDEEAAAREMQVHLTKIFGQLQRIRNENEHLFGDDSDQLIADQFLG